MPLKLVPKLCRLKLTRAFSVPQMPRLAGSWLRLRASAAASPSTSTGRRPRSTSTAPVCPRSVEAEAVEAVDAEEVAGLPYEQMPGPTPLPLIGNTWRLMPVVGEFNAGLAVARTAPARHCSLWKKPAPMPALHARARLCGHVLQPHNCVSVCFRAS